MKNSLLLLMCLLVVTGCDYKKQAVKKVKRAVKVEVQIQKHKPQPCVDVPCEVRYRNPDGSCVHCSWCQLLEHNNMHEMAVWWNKKYHGGENAYGLRNKANAAGLKIADTTNGNFAFVEWACRTGRGCIVNDRPGHVRTLVGMDPPGTPDPKVYINDNNGPPERIIAYRKSEWIQMWRGWAATPVYNPAPPRTKI